jgi:hypothetical protein
MVSRRMFKDSVTDPVLNFRNRVTKLLHDSLSLQGLNGVRVGGSRHDNESDDGGLGSRLLKSVVQTWMTNQSDISAKNRFGDETYEQETR